MLKFLFHQPNNYIYLTVALIGKFMAKSLNVIVEFKSTNESLLYHFKAKGI